jgi:hypothetical protein
MAQGISKLLITTAAGSFRVFFYLHRLKGVARCSELEHIVPSWRCEKETLLHIFLNATKLACRCLGTGR